MTTSRVHRSVSPVPPLSRASTPGSSAPATPVLPSAFLSSSTKMASPKPQVDFAPSVVSSSYRIPEYDERSVMREFAQHATHCPRCCDPERAVQERLPLCRRGTELAKDIGKYFYCWDGKPYSTIDRKRGERVQVEVPREYGVIKTLFEALNQGLTFSSLRQKRPEVHQTQSTPAPTRAAPYQETAEIRPSRTGSTRRPQSDTYTGHGPNYENRAPEDYEPREPRRETNRGSLYLEERRSNRRPYVVPIKSQWLR